MILQKYEVMTWDKFRDLFNVEFTCSIQPTNVIVYTLFIKKLKMRYCLQYHEPKGYEVFTNSLVGNENSILRNMIKYARIEDYLGAEIIYPTDRSLLKYIR